MAAVAPVLGTLTPPPVPPKQDEPIRESIEGSVYTNHSYGFRLYKPPSWDAIPDARAALESAVAMLGSSDESTLLVIADEPLHGAIERHAAATEQRLRASYENYRVTGSAATRVAGLAASERHYRGEIDGHDWSGVIVTFARGSEVFTIVGATRADSDLVQIQENVIARVIRSFEFSGKQ